MSVSCCLCGCNTSKYYESKTAYICEECYDGFVEYVDEEKLNIILGDKEYLINKD